MPTTFSLIRHGAYPLVAQALGGRDPHALSDTGRAQAARVAAGLATRRIGVVVTSPVQRARETADIIAARLALPVAVEPGFTEIDYGAWTGAQFGELDGVAAWRAWNRFRSTAAVPGGETMLAVQARMIAGLARLGRDHPDTELAVVSHGDPIKAVLLHFLGAPLDLMHRIEIGPGSISRVALSAEDATVLAVNLPP